MGNLVDNIGKWQILRSDKFLGASNFGNGIFWEAADFRERQILSERNYIIGGKYLYHIIKIAIDNGYWRSKFICRVPQKTALNFLH